MVRRSPAIDEYATQRNAAQRARRGAAMTVPAPHARIVQVVGEAPTPLHLHRSGDAKLMEAIPPMRIA